MTDKRVEFVFGRLEEAVAKQERCPTNPEFAALLKKGGHRAGAGTIPSLFRILVRENRIVVKVYANNWRQVEILKGKYTGKSSKGPPHEGKPYAVIDATERARRDSLPKWRAHARFR